MRNILLDRKIQYYKNIVLPECVCMYVTHTCYTHICVYITHIHMSFKFQVIPKNYQIDFNVNIHKIHITKKNQEQKKPPKITDLSSKLVIIKTIWQVMMQEVTRRTMIILFIPEAWKISGALLIIDKRMAYQI